MAEIILKNQAEFSGVYDNETISFLSNEVSTRILQGLTATKAADKTTWVNGALTYTFTITNNTGATVENIRLVDALDPDIITFDPTGEVMINDEPTTNYNYTASVMVINMPALEDGQTMTASFRVLQV